MNTFSYMFKNTWRKIIPRLQFACHVQSDIPIKFAVLLHCFDLVFLAVTIKNRKESFEYLNLLKRKDA